MNSFLSQYVTVVLDRQLEETRGMRIDDARRTSSPRRRRRRTRHVIR